MDELIDGITLKYNEDDDTHEIDVNVRILCVKINQRLQDGNDSPTTYKHYGGVVPEIEDSWIMHSECLSKYIIDSCLSLYSSSDDGFLLHRGSGCFVKYQNRYYFITAEHLIKDHKEIPLYISYKRSLNQIGGNFITSPNTKIDDKSVEIDIAFIEIDDFKIFDKTNFIDIDKNLVIEKIITFYGFPSSQNKPHKISRQIKDQPFSYTGNSVFNKYFIEVPFDKKRVLDEIF